MWDGEGAENCGGDTEGERGEARPRHEKEDGKRAEQGAKPMYTMMVDAKDRAVGPLGVSRLLSPVDLENCWVGQGEERQ